jgi:hypothetical protein
METSLWRGRESFTLGGHSTADVGDFLTKGDSAHENA